MFTLVRYNQSYNQEADCEVNALRVTVWSVLQSEGIIGPYSIEDQDRVTVIINGNTYRTVPSLDSSDMDNVWFQQIGATSQISDVIMSLLREKFDNH